VVAFVVNDEEEWGFASENMAAVCTDYPARFQSYAKADAAVAFAQPQSPPLKERVGNGRGRSFTSFVSDLRGQL